MEKKAKVAPAQHRKEADMFCMTCLMTITTIIAGWNITCVWSGIVTLICGMVTMWFVREEVKVYGEAYSGRKRKRKTI